VVVEAVVETVLLNQEDLLVVLDILEQMDPLGVNHFNPEILELMDMVIVAGVTMAVVAEEQENMEHLTVLQLQQHLLQVVMVF
jgi:hypothetical protein